MTKTKSGLFRRHYSLAGFVLPSISVSAQCQHREKKFWHKMILRGPANTSTLIHSLIHSITPSHSLQPSHHLSFTLSPSLNFFPSDFFCLSLSLSFSFHPTRSVWFIHLSCFCHFKFYYPSLLVTFCLSVSTILSLMLNFVANTLSVSKNLIHTRTAATSQTWELSSTCTVCNWTAPLQCGCSVPCFCAAW